MNLIILCGLFRRMPSSAATPSDQSLNEAFWIGTPVSGIARDWHPCRLTHEARGTAAYVNANDNDLVTVRGTLAYEQHANGATRAVVRVSDIMGHPRPTHAPRELSLTDLIDHPSAASTWGHDERPRRSRRQPTVAHVAPAPPPPPFGDVPDPTFEEGLDDRDHDAINLDEYAPDGPARPAAQAAAQNTAPNAPTRAPARASTRAHAPTPTPARTPSVTAGVSAVKLDRNGVPFKERTPEEWAAWREAKKQREAAGTR